MPKHVEMGQNKREGEISGLVLHVKTTPLITRGVHPYGYVQRGAIALKRMHSKLRIIIDQSIKIINFI